MCGIIGINSNKPVSGTIINSLKKLEYRGYDSAGIDTLSNGLITEINSSQAKKMIDDVSISAKSRWPLDENTPYMKGQWLKL